MPFAYPPDGGIQACLHRSPKHNRVVGGATRSKHLDGAAFDIATTDHDPVAFGGEAEQTKIQWTFASPNPREVGFLGFGFYPRSGFIHVDLGPARQWGERWRGMDRFHDCDGLKYVVLDMDSSVSSTHGKQEGTAWSGHFDCTCYHPLLLFTQFGML